MTTFPPTTTVFIFFLIFFVATFIKALALKRQKDLFFCKLTEANGFFDELAEELKVIHEEHEKTKQFKTSLTAAELTTQLQKPRLSSQTYPATNSIPEKYSFVHSLIKKNMSSDEIASILAISVHEAAQLVTLSKLGRTQ